MRQTTTTIINNVLEQHLSYFFCLKSELWIAKKYETYSLKTESWLAQTTFPLDSAVLFCIPSNLPGSSSETLPNYFVRAGLSQVPDNWLSLDLSQATVQNLEAAAHLLQILGIPCCSISNNTEPLVIMTETLQTSHNSLRAYSN